MMTVTNLSAYYGNIRALNSVNLKISEGQIVALLGPNGAGKTTVMMSISGVVKTSPETRITLDDGTELAHLKPEAIVKHRISQVPQGRGVFPGLTVRENLIMGAYLRRSKKEIIADIDHVLLSFPRLKDRLAQLAGTLSGGEQQMLAIMRGLMSRPRLLMLDEPSMGLAPIIVEQIYENISDICKQGTTIFLVEQNTYMALQVADYAYILSNGTIVQEGDVHTMAESEQVIASYFKN